MYKQATYFAPGGAYDGRANAVMFGAGDTQRIEVELENRAGSAAVRAEVRAYWRNGQLWKLHLTGTQSSRGWKSMFRKGWKPMFRQLASQTGRGAKGILASLKKWSDGSSNSRSRVTRLFHKQTQ